MVELFSDRHEYQAPDAEITVRYDAPENLRCAIPRIADNAGMDFKHIREIVCNVLVTRPDRENNWSRPNVFDEIDTLLKECYWYKTYDIAEALYQGFYYDRPNKAEKFARELNKFFRENGIGWQIDNGEIIFRGSEALEIVTKEAAEVLLKSKLPRAADQVKEARSALSLRPNPDTTGAINHAMGALESTARAITEQSKPTLGALIPKLNLPKPLDNAVEKLWGYSSEYARHIQEGREVDTDEAELVVTVAAAVCIFLSKQKPT